MIPQEFKQHLEGTTLAASTKRIYYFTIKQLLNENGNNPSIEQLNHFIANKFKKRQGNAKYAIKEWLKFSKRDNEFNTLIKVKSIAPLKEKHFLPKETISQIINNIKNQQHKVMAMIQYNTGARASEIITIEKVSIRKEKYGEKERIRIQLKGKGNKPRYVYMLMDFWKHIEPYHTNARRYLFIKEPVTYYGFWTRVETVYHGYYDNLKEAAKECGYNISTHDLRRSFANNVRQETRDIFKIQQALGHTDINTTTKYLEEKKEDIADLMLKHQKDFL